MRRLIVPLVFLLAASTATAATIRGTKVGDLVIGTQRADRVLSGPGDDRVQIAFGGADSADCGAGVDVVSADATDRVAANCEIVSRRLSVDPYANPDSQHETAVEPDSFSFGNTVVAVFQVGRREGGAASNIGAAVSRDAGRTWTRSFLPGMTVNASPPGPELAASDPSIAYDATHRVWLAATLTIERVNFSHIYVTRSVDGAHWDLPIDAASGPTLDKEWIACDNGAASPFRGRCYLEYTDDDKNMTVSQSSDDGGLTWTPAVRSTSLLVGTQPVVLPDGTLVVVAGDYPNEEGTQGAFVAVRSTDGGATFTPFHVADLRAADNSPMRALALPSVDVDAAGTIYAAWHDCRFRPDCSQNDIVISTSTDGQTWTPPVRVPLAPTSSGFSAFLPGLAADLTHAGRLGLVYAYFYPGSRRLGMGLVQSRDNGKTWTKPQPLDAQPMQTNWLPRAKGRMVGDYFSVSYAGSRVVPVFALATSPVGTRFREGIFAASLRALG